jgi:SH3-like domain-containing protein
MRLRVGRPGVELLAEPFQAEARVLAELGPGDEVEILELEDPWVKVQTPLGDSGWIDAAALSAT